MASDEEEEEELAQLRAQRSQRTGVAELVRRAAKVTATSMHFGVLALFMRSQTSLCRHAERPSTETKACQHCSFFLL